MYKFVTLVIVILILVISLPSIYKQQKESRVHVKKVLKSTSEKPTEEFVWSFQTVEDRKNGEVKTRVFLHKANKKYDMGVYSGVCTQVKSSNLIENEVSAVLCWHRGFGNEIGVFKDTTGYTVKLGEVQKGENEGFRGNFKELLSF